jgi:error-prone DNA polymerase
LAEADAFHALRLERREALWGIRGLRDDVLPLFAAADAGRFPRPEIIEPSVPIAPMTAGREVVDDYASVGLTLRQHPAAFLRDELQTKGIVPCVDLLTSRDGQRVTVAGGPGCDFRSTLHLRFPFAIPTPQSSITTMLRERH